MIWNRENKTWYSDDIIDKIIYACMEHNNETSRKVMDIIKEAQNDNSSH